jgi:DNA repair exonuclease SbcCD ATPase subunit
MTLPEKKTSNGWLSQAERLAIMHGTAGTTAINTVELARQQPLLKLATSGLDSDDPDELLDAATREIQLAQELELALAKITGFERRLTQEKAASESLKRELECVSEQLGASEATVADLETELAAAQNTVALRENEALSLQTSFDLVSAENSRLQAQLRLSGSMLEDAKAQTKNLWNEAAASETKRVTHMREAERYRAEAEAKDALFKAAKSRAELAEQLHAKARERLSFSVEENSVNTHKIAKLRDTCNDMGRKLDELQHALRAKQIQIDELEKSRSDLAAATNALLTSYQDHRSAWLQSMSRTATDAPKVGQVPAESPAVLSRDGYERRRSTWVELARELTKLNLKRQLAGQARVIPTPVLLANTINF